MKKFNTAVFNDFENVIKGYDDDAIAAIDLNRLMEEIKSCTEVEGIAINNAYANFGNYKLNKFKRPLFEASISTVNVYAPTTYKNLADNRLTVDVMDALYQHPELETYVLVTGDGGYIPMVQRLHESGKTVICCGYEANTSWALKKICDLFLPIADRENKVSVAEPEPVVVADVTPPSVAEPEPVVVANATTPATVTAPPEAPISGKDAVDDEVHAYHASPGDAMPDARVKGLTNKGRRFLEGSREPHQGASWQKTVKCMVAAIGEVDIRAGRVAVVEQVHEALIWLAAEDECRETLAEGYSLPVIHLILKGVIKGFDIRELGYKKFTAFLGDVVAGTHLAIADNRLWLQDAEEGDLTVACQADGSPIGSIEQQPVPIAA
ncbi:MAG: NYN domain-containing protein [Coriobacteriales bacterium]|jgi:uncharacterized LabA/DUF88 family protein|nr:NYN domain-containing protein [Coriobacteriales bacterium]